MKVLVTGATGYVGHNLSLALAQDGNEVNILVRNPKSANIPRHPRIHIFTGDVTKKETIGVGMQGCEKVFHAAALVQFCARKPSAFYDINVDGTRNMLDAALEYGVKKFVFTSTGGVIGPSLNKPMTESDPRITGFNNDYDLSKFLAEKLVIDYATTGLHSIVATATKVYGPGIETHPLSLNGVIRRFIEGKIGFCPSPADFIANYVFVDDLVRGHIQASEKGRRGEKYILGGENLTYHNFFKILRNISGKKSRIVPVSKKVISMYGACHFMKARLFHREPFFNSKAVSQIFCHKSFSSSKAMEELGYTITPFSAALQQTIHSLKNKIHA